MAFDFQKYIEKMEEDARNNNIGNLLAAGIGVGLSEDSYLAITAMDDVYVRLETVSKNHLKNIENYEKKKRDRELKNLKNALTLQLITEQEYYEQLKIYRDENLAQGTDLWYETTEEIVKYNQRVWNEALKTQEEALKAQEETAEKISGIQEKLAENLKENNAALATSTKVTFHNTGLNGGKQIFQVDELHNFEEDIQLLEQFRDGVISLKNLGYMPDEFFAEIADMDVEEATFVMNKILAASEESRRQFADGYRTKNTLAEDVAAELYGILSKKELEKAGIYPEEIQEILPDENVFTQQLEESFEEVPQEYYELGEESGLAFGEGLEGGIVHIMSEARLLIMDMMSSLAEAAVLKAGELGQSVFADNSSVHNTTYNFNASRDTTTEQLFAAKAAAALSKLRGVN